MHATMLNEGIEYLERLLGNIFLASLTPGDVLIYWQKVKVGFIVNPGTYTHHSC